MPINPFAFQRDPIWAKIAFLKNVSSNTEDFCMRDRRPMNGSAIAKENLIGNPIFLIEAIEKISQFLQSATKID